MVSCWKRAISMRRCRDPTPRWSRHVKQYLEPILSQADATLSERGRWVVYDLLVSHHASSDQVASRLGISWRTLHRQLARDGESFSSILQCSAERLGAALC